MKFIEMSYLQLKEKLKTFTLETATPEEIAELKELANRQKENKVPFPTIMLSPEGVFTTLNTGIEIKELDKL